MNKIEEKMKEEIKKLQIYSERAKGNLVEKEVVKSMLKEVVQAVGEAFAGLPKTYATLYREWRNTGISEKDVEMILSEVIEKSLKSIVEKIKELSVI